MEVPEVITFKLLVVGDLGVGKSSLLLRYAENKYYSAAISTIGMDLKIKAIELDGRRLKLEIWDSTGQERFRKLMPSYMRGAHGILLVFDLTRAESFDNLPSWMDEIERWVEPGSELLVIANKLDQAEQRVITKAQCTDFAEKYNVRLVECSARDASNVTEAFEELAQRILAKRLPQILKNAELNAASPSVSLGRGGNSGSASGCSC